MARTSTFLETPRLSIRDFRCGDWSALAPILANPQTMRFSPTGALSASQTRRKLVSYMASYQRYGFGKRALILKANGALIGYCGLAVETIDHIDEVELGYRLHPQYWGQGLATEAAIATIQDGFKRFDFSYILGVVEPENSVSVRVLEKIGMRYTRPTLFQGIPMDVYQLKQGRSPQIPLRPRQQMSRS